MMRGGFRTRILVLQMKQDDPRKCSSAKLCRLNLATPIHHARGIPKKAIVLNPSARDVFSPKDRPSLEHGLVAIDCSWKKAEYIFDRQFKGINRRLPILLAANPINYAKPSMLSSVEAISATLYVAGFTEHAQKILSVFKWGHTFLTLNHEPLEDYRSAKTPQRIREIEGEYFRP